MMNNRTSDVCDRTGVHVYDNALFYRIEYHGKQPIIRLMKEDFPEEDSKYPRYASLRLRAETFVTADENSETVSWNDVCPHIHGGDMAAAGFFRWSFTAGPDTTEEERQNHSTDSVRCFSCGIMLYDWSLDDNPLWEHVKHAPTCRFAFRALMQSQLAYPWQENITTGNRGCSNVRATSASKLLSSLNHRGQADDDDDDDDAHKSNDSQQLAFEQTKYHCERERLISFFRHTENMPDPSNMANSGFYYVGPCDQTRCFACGFTFANWSSDDCPMLTHAKLSPNCPFVCGINCGNAPMSKCDHEEQIVGVDDVNDEAETPPDEMVMKIPEFANRRKRILSFGTWWLAEAMADAGFFYTGSYDRVQCYACGGTLSKLYDDDNSESPKELHAFWFPRCTLSIQK